jgi:hypothetical protein
MTREPISSPTSPHRATNARPTAGDLAEPDVPWKIVEALAQSAKSAVVVAVDRTLLPAKPF